MSVKHILIAQDGAVMCTKKQLCDWTVFFLCHFQDDIGHEQACLEYCLIHPFEQCRTNSVEHISTCSLLQLYRYIRYSSQKKRTNNGGRKLQAITPKMKSGNSNLNHPSKPPFFTGFSIGGTARLDYNPWRRPRCENCG